MTYYLDAEYRVHTAPADGRTPWEDTEEIFGGKCRVYIEGYRVVPAGQTWTAPDGTAFAGEMIAPAVDALPLLAAQGAYEQARSESDEALCDVAEMALDNLLAIEMLQLGGETNAV